jgi:hypothetical protein
MKGSCVKLASTHCWELTECQWWDIMVAGHNHTFCYLKVENANDLMVAIDHYYYITSTPIVGSQ